MLQLLYTSTATCRLTRTMVDDICEQSRGNNRRDEVTGILVTRGDRFLQALEGPKNTVEDTFMRLMVDPRHHHLTLLNRRILTTREFGDWDMLDCGQVGDHPDLIARIRAALANATEASRSAFDDFLH